MSLQLFLERVLRSFAPLRMTNVCVRMASVYASPATGTAVNSFLGQVSASAVRIEDGAPWCLRFHSWSWRRRDWCFLTCDSSSEKAFLQAARTLSAVAVAWIVPVGSDKFSEKV